MFIIMDLHTTAYQPWRNTHEFTDAIYGIQYNESAQEAASLKVGQTRTRC
jgi:hypothetical protein